MPVKRSNGWVCLAAPIHKFHPKVMRQPQNQPIITDHVSVFAHPTDSYEIHRITWNRRSPTKYIQVSSLFFLPFTFIFFAPKEKPPQRFCLSSSHFLLFRVSLSLLFSPPPTQTAKLLNYAPPRENSSTLFTDSSANLFLSIFIFSFLAFLSDFWAVLISYSTWFALWLHKASIDLSNTYKASFPLYFIRQLLEDCDFVE